MIIRMKLLSDCIFGSGQSVPGGEDIGIICDKDGFPYLKASAFRGILREEAENLSAWDPENYQAGWIEDVFGSPGMEVDSQGAYVHVSDLVLPKELRDAVLEEVKGETNVTDIFTSLRTFTALEEGIVKEGSLRIARCVNQGFCFYGTVDCRLEDEDRLEEVISLVKWVGGMRTRGFGHVDVSVLYKRD